MQAAGLRRSVTWAALACVLAVAACATDGAPVRTTEAKAVAATLACHAPRDAILLGKDGSYRFNPAYAADNRTNCLEWQLLDCKGGQKMFEPMGCVVTRD